MRTQKEISDLLASIRSGLARSKKQDFYKPEEIGMWNMVIAVLEWVMGSENAEVEAIKSGQ